MKIEELMYYGRYYNFEKRNYHLWWFDVSRATVVLYEDVKRNFGYASQEEIVSAGAFVPLFETDIIELEKDFLRLYNFHLDENNKQDNSDFDTKFKCFIEKHNLLKQWFDFERDRLERDALTWCKANNLQVE